jgi:hypothetical protein
LGQFLVARILIKLTKKPGFSKTKKEMRYSISSKPLELQIGSQKVKRKKKKIYTIKTRLRKTPKQNKKRFQKP